MKLKLMLYNFSTLDIAPRLSSYSLSLLVILLPATFSLTSSFKYSRSQYGFLVCVRNHKYGLNFFQFLRLSARQEISFSPLTLVCSLSDCYL